MTIASVLTVLIDGDSRPLTASLAQASASTKAFAATTSSASASTRAMSSGLGAVKLTAATAGVALALFAKNAFDTAKAYDRAFGRIDAITSSTDERIASMREEIMKLSGETARSPVELADAFYFLASAGLSVTEQNQALTTSAQLSAIGLGETADIAKITAQALNVYAESGLTARQVADALAAAIREGTAEPEQFADALGRVLPVAAKAGISFDEVTASLATMSNAGLDVHEGVTAIRAVMQSLLAPTKQTETALASLGLTTDQLRDSLAEDGLISTLRMLDERAHGNIDTLRDLIPNIRGMVGAFNLTEQQAAEVDKIFDEVANSTGDLSRAMEDLARNDAFRLEQATQKISNEFTKLMGDVLPALADMLGVVAGAISTVSDFLEDQPTLVDAIKVAVIALLALKIVSFLTNWATASAATAGANTALAASQVAVNTTAATGAAPVFLMGKRVAETGAAAANAAKSTGLFAGGLGAIGSAAARAAPGIVLALAAAKGWEQLKIANPFDETAFDPEQFGLNALRGMAEFTGQWGILAGIPESSTTRLKEAKLLIGEINEAVENGAIGANDANAKIEELADTYGLDLGDGIHRAVVEQSAWVGRQAAAEKAAMAANNTLKDQKETMKAGADDAKRFGLSLAQVNTDLDSLAGIAGVSYKELHDAGRQAFVEDGKLFGKNWHDFTEGVLEDVAKMTDGFREAVTFVDDTVGELLEKDTPVTAGGLLGAFDDARKQTQAYGKDLLEIAGIGKGAGRELMTWVTSLGAEGVEVASAIAGASKSMQGQLVESFNAGQDAADRVANQMQRKVVGTLKDIENLLKFLVTGDWEFFLKADDKDAKQKVTSLGEQLFNLTNKKWIIELDIQGNKGAPPVEGSPGGGSNNTRPRGDHRSLDRTRFEEDFAHTREYTGPR